MSFGLVHHFSGAVLQETVRIFDHGRSAGIQPSLNFLPQACEAEFALFFFPSQRREGGPMDFTCVVKRATLHDTFDEAVQSRREIDVLSGHGLRVAVLASFVNRSEITTIGAFVEFCSPQQSYAPPIEKCPNRRIHTTHD